MRVVVQKVLSSSVEINGEIYNSIGRGLMVLVGFTQGDDSSDIDYLVKKVANLRIFEDENDIMNKSVLDVNGSVLSISQFTLYGDARKGNRPSYIKALNGDKASPLYDKFNEELSKYVKVSTGVFGSDMEINFTNIGPVTIIIEK